MKIVRILILCEEHDYDMAPMHTAPYNCVCCDKLLSALWFIFSALYV